MAMPPWDIRLARVLVRPLQQTRVSPNHLTTLSLIAGLAAAALYASGNSTAADWAAVLFILAILLDHADGELARRMGKTSWFGHCYDQFAGMVTYIGLFVGIGVGLPGDSLADWAVPLGVAAGVGVSAIFALRFEMERRQGKELTKQPDFAGFEIEDIMYLVGPITWLNGLQPFLIAAGIGAPLFALWVLWQYWHRPSPVDSSSRRS